jgi:hypothetical protein
VAECSNEARLNVNYRSGGHMIFSGRLKITLAICRATICALHHMDSGGLREFCEASLKDRYRCYAEVYAGWKAALQSPVQQSFNSRLAWNLQGALDEPQRSQRCCRI